MTWNPTEEERAALEAQEAALVEAELAAMFPPPPPAVPIRRWRELSGEEVEWRHPIDGEPHCRVELRKYGARSGPGAPEYVWYGACEHFHVYRADVVAPDPARPFRSTPKYEDLWRLAQMVARTFRNAGTVTKVAP